MPDAFENDAQKPVEQPQQPKQDSERKPKADPCADVRAAAAEAKAAADAAAEVIASERLRNAELSSALDAERAKSGDCGCAESDACLVEAAAKFREVAATLRRAVVPGGMS